MFSVNIAPDMAMYSLLISQGYDPANAICEFIDNSIHAFQENKSKGTLNIKVKYYSNGYQDKDLRNSLVIDDDGPGISEEVLKDALKPAKPPMKKGLSEFGIGMKAASVWFANEWKLETWPISAGKHLKSTFNLEKLLQESKDEIIVTDIEYTGDKTGTVITLSGLRKAIDDDKYNYICRNLGDIYQRFIGQDKSKVTITSYYDDDRRLIAPISKKPKVLHAPKHVQRGKLTLTSGKSREWSVNVNMQFEDHPVKGNIMLREKGSYKSPGLVLFRHNRVICGTGENPYRPIGLFSTSNKAASMRVYGELDLDDHPVSYTKDGFSFDDKSFATSLSENSAELAGLFQQAERFRKETHGSLEDYEKTKKQSGHNDNEVRAAFETEANKGETQRESSKTTEVEPMSVEDETLNTKTPKKIGQSKKIVVKLNRLSSMKLSQLYNSLCIVSLEQHPALMYVGAWAFFETLARLSGSNGNSDFQSYYSSKAQSWGISAKSKKSISKALKKISDEGNSTKHCERSVPLSAIQLANDFEVLEELIVKALEAAIIKESNVSV